ncbi:MAG: DUF2851 family protein [Prevotella sp.]|uniref:DUF2851 family protein n=1 Tax=Prevotella sp. TaxID=59823 RepID=UPI002A350639|nr:DUF2851 family protein [Prevotella sp.]MDD7318407.1 DUF2851 family protein [Prevotellaceae bacterium]MDY4020242.1 DUF2851 family protein [Prevotella sp.]
MELLLHYCWKHRLFPLQGLVTTGGIGVEVIDPGLPNSNAGPDFFNAKVKVGGTLWVGNVEIHDRASDWYRHGHDHDKAYNNVVLHVAETTDRDVTTASGNIIPQIQLSVPQHVREHYAELLSIDKYPPCHKIVPGLSQLMMHGWLTVLQTERLEQKTIAIKERLEQAGGSWETAYFITLARNFGFGVNGDAFETWAKNIPLSQVGHHRDDLFQVEAFFMGQAGLLEPSSMNGDNGDKAAADSYFESLRNEYLYLSRKFSLQPMDTGLWRFLRLRPQNFPHIRLAQLALLYHERRSELSRLLECETPADIRSMLSTRVTPYWETHYTFGSSSGKAEKSLTAASLNLLIINTAVPILFAYGRHKQKELFCDRAMQMLEEMRAENNHITRMWRECGLEVTNAGDSQALIQLKKEYCDRKDCLRCRIGGEYLRRDKQQ